MQKGTAEPAPRVTPHLALRPTLALFQCSQHLPPLRLPEMRLGQPIEVSFLPELRRVGRNLESGTENGYAVHAATYLRQRRMVLETELLTDAPELRRILVHELFHFVWMRLGNPSRAEWRALLAGEFGARARGELGWSAEWRKDALRGKGMGPDADYACESFCDTAAWLYAGVPAHDEFTLAQKWRKLRRDYFQRTSAKPFAV